MTGPDHLLERKLETLPDGPGVYLWKDRTGQVLYVGKAKNLRSRVRSYFPSDHSGSLKNQLLVRQIVDVETIVVASETQSLLLENNLIKEHQPRFNVRLKDDKSYPSIAVTMKEPFPRVLVTRRRDLPGARYFGPYTDVADMRRSLALIRRIFTVRTCSDDLPASRRERPCLDYHIGRCKAPCVARQEQADYRSMIDEVIRFLEGKTGDVRSRLRDMMLAASGGEDFERACDLRDALKWLEQVDAPAAVDLLAGGDADVVGYARDGDDVVCVLLRVRDGRMIARDHRILDNLEDVADGTVLEHFLIRYYLHADDRSRRVQIPFPPTDFDAVQAVFADAEFATPIRGTGKRWLDLADRNAQHLLESLKLESFETDERSDDPVYALGRALGMATVPRTLICVDISTNQGRDTVGSLVWFEAGRPKKAEYRKFKIKGPGQQDDFAAIHEVVTRYFSRRVEEQRPLPDLVVIDGGKGQLSSALDAMSALGLAAIPLIGLAKKEEEIFVPGAAESLRLSRRSTALRLLQRARDEAHRFGVTYNRKRRTDRTITSALLTIPGVGPNRRRALIERFGSLAGVKSANAAEISTLAGFSTKLAERILEHLKTPST
ncbi:MAG: excinuclease ABC subunit UvrC [Gemmatimonadetes bacterium]|nr:excinuclease ABC subunit UvrC [Gemmatimonadota bacterium]